MRSRSKSGVISKAASTWSSISRCCAVTQIFTAYRSGERFSSSTSGASLIASGRVPKIKRIVRCKRSGHRETLPDYGMLRYMAKVLVTGGAGYIGSQVAHVLAARGADVIVVDDLSRGHRHNVEPHRLRVRSLADTAFLIELMEEERFD